MTSMIVRQNKGHFEPYLTIRSKVFFIVSSYSANSKVLKITCWTSVSSGQLWEISWGARCHSKESRVHFVVKANQLSRYLYGVI